MDALTCITTRMSIRKFTDQPVPRELLEKVFDTARWSPSYKNTQPWQVVVLTGEKKKALSSLLIDLFSNGTPSSPDIPAPAGWPAPEKAKIDHLFQRRAEATGLDLGDPEILKKAKIANFRFYGAPYGVYLFQDNALSQWSLFDIGLFAQTFMLAAHAHGLGTVPQAFATDYAAETKAFLNIPATSRLVLGLSVGYPAVNSPANSFRTDRMAMNDFVQWQE